MSLHVPEVRGLKDIPGRPGCGILPLHTGSTFEASEGSVEMSDQPVHTIQRLYISLSMGANIPTRPGVAEVGTRCRAPC